MGKIGNTNRKYQYDSSITYSNLTRHLNEISEALSLLPEGKLITSKSSNYIKYYHRNGNTLTYIKKNEQDLINQLALKLYLTHEKAKIEGLIRAEAITYKTISDYKKAMDRFLQPNSNYSSVVKKILQNENPEIQTWLQATSSNNPAYPENLKHFTHSGVMVRSKSEVIIANSLFENKIPFKYEVSLSLGEKTIYPDFTIMNPYTHKIYYWEHFGIFDDPIYRNDALGKIAAYSTHGIFPGDSLIMTFETSDIPLNSNEVQNIIATKFDSINY
jgi:hypothetical protein